MVYYLTSLIIKKGLTRAARCIDHKFTRLFHHRVGTLLNQFELSKLVYLSRSKSSCKCSNYILSRSTKYIADQSKQLSFVQQRGINSSGPASKQYLELYLNKNITFLRLLGRFARYSSYICLFGSPIALLTVQMQILSQQSAVNLITVLSFYAVLFLGQSFIFSSKIIGKIMISSDKNHIKISHLSLFGDRRDIYVEVSDILTISGDIFSSNLKKVCIKNYSRSLFFLPQLGGIDTNYEVLELLFKGLLKNKNEHKFPE